MKFLFLLFFVNLASCWVTLDNDPRVTLKQGRVRGMVKTSRNGKTFFSFQGIPYAAPPLKDRRFKGPEEASPWVFELNAKHERSACVQMHMLLNTFLGNEDCLYLNVYTPQIEHLHPTKKGLCVMIWIHGGGFMFGSGGTELYGPHFLLDHDIVLVTFNYRLGALGFLSLETPETPGNYGLKDQVAALRWVQKNIAKFGGNPECVTIFGESAGGASVHYLMLSPLAKGLFHRAIVQSGSAYNPWAITHNVTRQGHRHIVKELGCTQSNHEKMLKCLRSVDARRYAKLSFQMVYSTMRNEPLKRNLFAPSLEPSDTPNAFLIEDPQVLLARGDVAEVPLMIGYMTHEGMLHLFGLNNLTVQQDYEEHLTRFLPVDLGLASDSIAAHSALQEIDAFYRNISSEFLEQYILMNSDVDFVLGIDDLARGVAALGRSPVFYYLFTYEGTFSILKKILKIRRSGTAHGDEIGYMFSQNQLRSLIWRLIAPDDALTADRITKLWTDFAKTGVPTPNGDLGVKWHAVESPLHKPNMAKTRYLDIGKRLVMMEKNLNDNRISFWHNIRTKYTAT